jgi:isopentenyldiphosphate isomerase
MINNSIKEFEIDCTLSFKLDINLQINKKQVLHYWNYIMEFLQNILKYFFLLKFVKLWIFTDF